LLTGAALAGISTGEREQERRGVMPCIVGDFLDDLERELAAARRDPSRAEVQRTFDFGRGSGFGTYDLSSTSNT
jgi:hypothetical protein